jgi:hypothetical protein
VALENVRSFGTEDRRTGEDFFPPSDSVYDYILFRGSDVKDLRVESRPNEQPKPQAPAMPADPAILGVRLTPSYLAFLPMMKYFGCKFLPAESVKTHVEISVAFLLISSYNDFCAKRIIMIC